MWFYLQKQPQKLWSQSRSRVSHFDSVHSTQSTPYIRRRGKASRWETVGEGCGAAWKISSCNSSFTLVKLDQRVLWYFNMDVLLVSWRESTLYSNLFWGLNNVHFIHKRVILTTRFHCSAWIIKLLIIPIMSWISSLISSELRITVKNALAGITTIMICTMVDN